VSYSSWEDLLDEQSPGEQAKEAVDGIGDPNALVQESMGDSLAPITEALDQASLPPELERIARQIPGLGDLFEQRDQLRDQLEQLTGTKGQPTQLGEDRFPLPDGPRQPLGSTDPRTRAQRATDDEAPRRAWWQGTRFARTTEAVLGVDPPADRDEARDQARHLRAFEATQRRMAEAGRVRASSRDARIDDGAQRRGAGAELVRASAGPDAMRADFGRQTGRMEQRAAQLERAGGRRGAERRQQRADQLRATAQKRRALERSWQEKRDRLRDHQREQQRAHGRFRDRQMRLQEGPTWLRGSELSNALPRPGEDVGRSIKRLSLAALPGTWKDRDGRLDIGKLFERDNARDAKRREEAQRRRMEERRRQRAEERTREEQKEGKRRKRKDKKG
jgi:hypothetical protein